MNFELDNRSHHYPMIYPIETIQHVFHRMSRSYNLCVCVCVFPFAFASVDFEKIRMLIWKMNTFLNVIKRMTYGKDEGYNGIM